jgi:hypothetical protein
MLQLNSLRVRWWGLKGIGAAKYCLDSETAVFPVRILVAGMVLFKESLAQWSPARKAKTEPSLSECLTHPLFCTH